MSYATKTALCSHAMETSEKARWQRPAARGMPGANWLAC